MKFTAYQRPHLVGWLGWFEDQDSNLVGFLGIDGHFQWHFGVNDATDAE